MGINTFLSCFRGGFLHCKPCEKKEIQTTISNVRTELNYPKIFESTLSISRVGQTKRRDVLEVESGVRETLSDLGDIGDIACGKI